MRLGVKTRCVPCFQFEQHVPSLTRDHVVLRYHGYGFAKLCTGGFFTLGWLADIILIALQIVKPADGTQYFMVRPVYLPIPRLLPTPAGEGRVPYRKAQTPHPLPPKNSRRHSRGVYSSAEWIIAWYDGNPLRVELGPTH